MDSAFVIRKAELGDIRATFDLSNDPVVRGQSIHPDSIPWEEHVRWFTAKLQNPDCELYIVEDQAKAFMAQVRIDKGEKNIVSISVVNAFRGRGLGQRILERIAGLTTVRPLTAYIKPTNAPSQRAFLMAGFMKIGETCFGGERYEEYGF